ncbi:hypothetical protein WL05_19835 [Burkholderia ubonensis]|nr:hypothetical protein WJ52_11085 [Burkholderia ubonensis]KVM21708.1 hypothetical protein WJ51_03255 [Burkholderia ubonensis]KVM43914.1 hypothetical protein WJ56_27995 [Burkholderia ubonensis]KVX46265.1 hypothetical protein WL05_19835 [Burkholderia ubonensis]
MAWACFDAHRHPDSTARARIVQRTIITDSRKFSPSIRTALVADLWRTPVARGIDRFHLL